MRQVITISLNNNAYQVEEDGYRALLDYLTTAEQRLTGNPDRSEILLDLEQAIADKCDSFLGAHKTVVTAAEVSQILAEMGPVAATHEAPTDAGAKTFDNKEPRFESAEKDQGRSHSKRLYRLPEGKLWGGVCTGLAAYLGIDVVWVRAVWVLLTLFTGVWLLVYLAALYIVPEAETAAERAQAHGTPFNAQDLIDSAREHYAQARQSYQNYRGQFRQSRRAAKQAARHWKREFRRNMRDAMPPPSSVAQLLGALLLPCFAIVSAALFVAMGLAVAMVLTGIHLQGWGMPLLNLPTWTAILLLLLAYAIASVPLGAGRRLALYYANGGSRHGWADLWSGTIWVATTLLLLWALHTASPELRQLFDQWLLQFNHHGPTTISL